MHGIVYIYLAQNHAPPIIFIAALVYIETIDTAALPSHVMLHGAHQTILIERGTQREREMSNHHRFKLSHLMPNSWFYKLRDMKKPRPASTRNRQTTRTWSKRSTSHYYHGAISPKPLLPVSPHRSYCYYLNTTHSTSLEKLHPSTSTSTLHRLNTKASDIQFPTDHHRRRPASRTMVIESKHEFQDLQLRPIRTRAVLTGSISGTSPSSPRLRSRRLPPAPNGAGGISTTGSAIGGGRRRTAARRSFAVVKASADPPRDFKESMVQMIVENDMSAPEDLQELLECYLSLNSMEYHGVIVEVFREIWLQIVHDIIDED